MALIEITLTIDGQAGPFDLYSDVDGFAVPFDTSVPAASLTAGYQVVAPAGTATVRVVSIGVCTNSIDLPTNCPTTTTTTSTSSTTTTTTSTSSTTTTTTTTEAPPNQLNWELITNTPSALTAPSPQTSNLKIVLNGVQVVNATIAGGATSQSGVIDINPGDVISATIETDRFGSFVFTNTVVKDGVFYQPQDVCNNCTDTYLTSMSPNYTAAGVDVDFTFVGDTNDPTTTTTTSSSTSTTSTSSTTSTTSTSSTTTTTTTCDCSLAGASAVVVSGTTTTTTTSGPSPGTRYVGVRSTLSSPVGAVGVCEYELNVFVYKDGVSAVPQIGDILYTSAAGPTVFNGGGNHWHYEPAVGAGAIAYIIEVNASGEIISSVPCNA